MGGHKIARYWRVEGILEIARTRRAGKICNIYTLRCSGAESNASFETVCPMWITRKICTSTIVAAFNHITGLGGRINECLPIAVRACDRGKRDIRET
jgi:hypothetical protein